MFVELVLFCVYVGSWECTQAIKLVWQVLYLMSHLASFFFFLMLVTKSMVLSMLGSYIPTEPHLQPYLVIL